MYNKFASQPHQPFFTSGILFFIPFLLMLKPNNNLLLHINNTILEFHSYPMMHLIFIQFFLGFLFVVFPRFLTQAEVKIKTYMNIFFLFTICGLTYILSLFLGKKLNQIAIVIHNTAGLVSFITLLSIYKKSIV